MEDHPDCNRPDWTKSGVMSGGSTGLTIKNTFLEVGGDEAGLMESLGWRRQTSEPVSVYTRRTPTEDDDSELDCDDFLRDVTPSLSVTQEFSRLGSPDAKIGASMPTDLGLLPPEDDSASSTGPSKLPKVLLLADSIPFREQQEQEQETRKSNPKENYRDRDNQLKDIDITKKEPPWTEVTTVMMRNLPNKYTQQMLLEELQDGGFRLQNDIDFFYLPMDHSNAANLGYCFINFVETALANAFASAFQGKKMRRFNSSKTVVVMPASIQGFDRNYAYYASTRVAQAEDPQYRPLFLRSPPVNQWSGPGSGAPGKGAGAGGGSGGKGRGAGKNANSGKNGGKGRGKDRGKPDSMDAFMGQDAVGYVDWSQQVGGMPPGAGPPWPGMQPMGPPQGMEVRPPPPQMQVAPGPGMAVCGNCGKECGRTHRFCAFCGSSIGQDGGKGGMINLGALRADAPTFVPSMAPGPGMGRPPNGLQTAPSPLQANRNRPDPDAGMFRANDPVNYSVTDELDVMRGRMMLLAALKDMEKREGRDDEPSPHDLDLPAGLSAALGGLAGNMEPMPGLPGGRGPAPGPMGQRPVQW